MFLDWHIPQTILASEHFLLIHLHCIWTIIPSLSHHLCFLDYSYTYTLASPGRFQLFTCTSPELFFMILLSDHFFYRSVSSSIHSYISLPLLSSSYLIHLCLLGLFFHFTASLGSFLLSISSLNYSYLSLPLLNGSHLFTSASLRITYSCFSQTILVYLFQPVLICLTNQSLHTYFFLFSGLYLSIAQCFHVYVFLNLSVISDQ